MKKSAGNEMRDMSFDAMFDHVASTNKDRDFDALQQFCDTFRGVDVAQKAIDHLLKACLRQGQVPPLLRGKRVYVGLEDAALDMSGSDLDDSDLDDDDDDWVDDDYDV